jgi:hypothetical protein
VNPVHEHSVQQMTFCALGVFSSTTRCLWCADMVRPSSATAALPFSSRRAAEVGIGPGAGDDLGAVGRDPLLFCDPGKLFDKPSRDQVPLLKCPLQRCHATFDGRGYAGRILIIMHEPNPSP